MGSKYYFLKFYGVYKIKFYYKKVFNRQQRYILVLRYLLDFEFFELDDKKSKYKIFDG